MGEVVLRILTAILSLAFVLFLAWVVIRWMGGRMPGMAAGGKGRMINVLDRVNTGKNSGLLLVRVGDKVLLVAYSEHNVQSVYDFDDPEGAFVPYVPPASGMSFTDALKDAASKFGKKNDGGGGL